VVCGCPVVVQGPLTMLPMPRRIGPWARFRQISNSQKIEGLAVLPGKVMVYSRQRYGLSHTSSRDDGVKPLRVRAA
jgi:hypothetical protein